MRALLRSRRLAIVAVDVVLVVAANFMAFWLRFDGEIPEPYLAMWFDTIPWLVAIRALTFVPLHLYDGVWQYVGVRDLRAIVIGVFSSTVMFYALIQGVLGVTSYPRSLFVIDSVLLVCLLSGVRLAWRLVREYRPLDRTRRVLIYGAGDAGEKIVRELVNGSDRHRNPVGFVDDEPAKLGQRIHGVPVLGTRRDLPRIIARAKPGEVVVAMPRAAPELLRAIVKALEPYKLPIKAVPRLRDLLDGRVRLSELHDLAVEDLLGRAPVGLDVEAARTLVRGKRVLVTGAGGSIGSELCRQVLPLEPDRLVLFERYENALWAVERSMAVAKHKVPVYPVIADATDESRVEAVLREHRPHIIFHAAAHKHVPLMEMHPCEAIKNNIKGTRIVTQAAIRQHVERFLLISSDKAVNPSSVMGASKRVAELLTMALAERGRSCLVVVRFGNVIGSNGSVIPLFLDQIRRGGPVTVTHPEMRRYFMLIAEAVQLVLQAAALGDTGARYVLDMGDEIKVLDMARHLIRLSGFIPDQEIPISIIGLRPGEKLSEELVGPDEKIEPSGVDGIWRVRGSEHPDLAMLRKQVSELEYLAEVGDETAALRQLGVIVPDFRPTSDREAAVPASYLERASRVIAHAMPQAWAGRDTA
jgi:FlaA1/EpsC-like NDP-sugar epimerase